MTIDEFEKQREEQKREEFREKCRLEDIAINKRHKLYNKFIKIRWTFHLGLLIALFFSAVAEPKLMVFIAIVMFFTAFEVFHGFIFNEDENKDLSNTGYADEHMTISSWMSITYSAVLIYFCYDNMFAVSLLIGSILTALPFIFQISDYESSDGLWFPGTGLGF